MISENQIVLKQLTLKDYSVKYLKWMNNKKIMEFTEQKYFKHTKKKIIEFIKAKQRSKHEYLYGIFLKNSLKVKSNLYHIGNIKLGPINFYHKSSFISYFIGEKKYWGMNIATIAIKKVLKIARKKFKLKKISACFYKNNIGSQRILEKNGFAKEAEFKSQLIYKNKRINHIYYGKILK